MDWYIYFFLRLVYIILFSAVGKSVILPALSGLILRDSIKLIGFNPFPMNRA